MSVYFIEAGRYVKVGYSDNPEQRFANLFKGATRYSAPKDVPFDLGSRRLLKVIDGSKNTERLIHHALDDFRVFAEWFIDEPELREFIANVETATTYEPVRRPAGEFIWDEDPILRPDSCAALDAALATPQTPTRAHPPRASA